jgi:hypothetical protein
MTPRRFEREDLFAINAWYKARGLPGVTLDTLPIIGQIVPNVAAGFLYLTDSSIALIEGVIANPDVIPEVRDIALDMIDLAITEDARRMGATHLIAVCVSPRLLKRSEHLGYTVGKAATILHKDL